MRCEQFVIILMLGFWSWSLVQFVLVVTGTTKARTKMTEIFGSQGGSPVMVSQSDDYFYCVGVGPDRSMRLSVTALDIGYKVVTSFSK